MHTPYSPPASPRSRRRSRPRPAARRQRRLPPQTEKGLLLEISARLVVNGVLACATLTSLARIIPHTQAQQQELQEVRAAVAIAEAQTSRLKTDFSRYFDPRQASNVMQEQSGWESPSQRQIVWIDPTKPAH